MMYVGFLFISFMTVMSFYSFFSIISFAGTVSYLKGNQLDELQKQVVYESFAYTFLTIVGLHFIQLAAVFFRVDLTHIVSPGTFQGTLIGMDKGFHMDSFFFDCLILSFVYFLRKVKYGLISPKEAKKRVLIPTVLTLILFAVSSVFYYLGAW
ncbi:hypothetical protein [Vagococcus carniphilus]|uniref:hypothetical protein n=1 Tax=Vagococcus carniphilus TaxID=218144 RepID=UPI003BAD0D2B